MVIWRLHVWVLVLVVGMLLVLLMDVAMAVGHLREVLRGRLQSGVELADPVSIGAPEGCRRRRGRTYLGGHGWQRWESLCVGC